jgi:hypothetical protein
MVRAGQSRALLLGGSLTQLASALKPAPLSIVTAIVFQFATLTTVAVASKLGPVTILANNA